MDRKPSLQPYRLMCWLPVQNMSEQPACDHVFVLFLSLILPLKETFIHCMIQMIFEWFCCFPYVWSHANIERYTCTSFMCQPEKINNLLQLVTWNGGCFSTLHQLAGKVITTTRSYTSLVATWLEHCCWVLLWTLLSDWRSLHLFFLCH